jgi:signal transduction histidine kinase
LGDHVVRVQPSSAVRPRRRLSLALLAALGVGAACADGAYTGASLVVALGALAVVASAAAAAARLGTARRRRSEEAALWSDAARIAELTRNAAVSDLEERVARELGAPIASLLNNLGAARRLLAAGERGPLPELVAAVDEAASDAERAALAIRGMRQLLPVTRREPLDVNDVARAAIGLVRRYAAAKGVALSSALCEPLPLASGDAGQLLQVALSLGLQAVENAAASRRRAVVVRTALGADGLELSFSDSGARISEVDRAHLFAAPSAATSGGLGLDVGAARSIVEANGGRLSAGRPDAGALFRVVLPASAPAAAGTAVAAPAARS